ncbi:MAG: RepA replication protein, partial [Rhodospirillales bacterium]|nr:RepA replication protein [Rhodospirillales bacterium]
HGGKQTRGWSFDFPYLHAKSGSLSPLKHFAYDLRDIVRKQSLPGYSLTINRPQVGPDRLSFAPTELLPFPRNRGTGGVKTHAVDKL